MITDPVQVDKISGQTTTGHEWDGIRELNTPLPRWWLWLFYICIAFSVGYWFVYPSWPLASSYTPRPVRVHQPRSGGGGRRGGAGGAHATRGGSGKSEPGGYRERSQITGDRPCSGQGGLRRQLLTVPCFGRAGPERLSQPDGRAVAVGRDPRRDRHDDHARHSRRRCGHPHERRCRPSARTGP